MLEKLSWFARPSPADWPVASATPWPSGRGGLRAEVLDGGVVRVGGEPTPSESGTALRASSARRPTSWRCWPARSHRPPRPL